MATTWNPADKSATITLTNSNLTATGTAVAGGVRGTTSQSTGKIYWEVTVGSVAPGSTSRIGVGNASQGLTANLGSTTTGTGYLSTGLVNANGGTSGTAATYTAGDVLGFAYNIGTNKIWIAKNGGLWNNSGTADPVAGTGGFATATGGGPWFICYVNNATNLAAFTMDPTGAAFGPPSGYTQWDTGSPPPPVVGYSGLLMMGM